MSEIGGFALARPPFGTVSRRNRAAGAGKEPK